MASPLSGILPAFEGRWANADHLAPVGERYERLSWAWRSTFRLLARSIDLDQHAQWLAIQRELRITFTDDEDTSHWRLDNLFLDGRGVPTLVEVKRSSDPRSRREVVAQLLDYAASFHADWSHGKLQDLWRSRDDEEHGSSGATFDDFLASSAFESETAFWDAVDTNVSAGKLRLLIVCDQLGGRLVGIIRFLNEQMEHIEVLGVAIQPRGTESGQQTLSVEVEGALEVPRNLASARRREPDAARAECRDRMRAATRHPIEVGSIAGQPYFTADVLADPTCREAVLREVEWILEQIAEARN